jgi:hypothetical protein
MPTRDIACLNCGHTGMLDIHRESDVVQRDLLFKHLGHNPFSGALHYRCPKCEIVLLVDPMAALGEESLKGFPEEVSDLPSRPWSDHRYVPYDLFRQLNAPGLRK